MTLFYYYDGASVFDGSYREGQAKVVLPNGHSIERVRHDDPPNEFYFAVEDKSVPPMYTHVGDVALSFTGTVNQANGRVVEDRRANDTPFTLDELMNAKQVELDQYNFVVATSPCQHDAGPLQFWVNMEDLVQMARFQYNGYLSMWGLDILYDAVAAGVGAGGSVENQIATWWAAIQAETYWERDVKVFLWTRDDPPVRIVDTANQNQWRDLQYSIGTFDHQYRSARDRVQQDLNTFYDASDYNALAAVDVADASYNWPTFYGGPSLQSLGGKSKTITEYLGNGP